MNPGAREERYEEINAIEHQGANGHVFILVATCAQTIVPCREDKMVRGYPMGSDVIIALIIVIPVC